MSLEMYTALLLFVCVGLHELGHSYIARKFGIVIRSITLYFFGGVSAMEETYSGTLAWSYR
jgi:Zn-dependent protease